MTIESEPNYINWIHIIKGKCIEQDGAISKENICFIPENKKINLKASEHSLILLCTVKNYQRFNTKDNRLISSVKIINWKKEPVLQSVHDNRMRIYIATKNLWGLDAVKGEIIIYPKNTRAPAHHHVGAEHFQFVLAGVGIALVNGKEIKVQAGDLIYNYENEIHWFKNPNSEAFSFAEFFVPGVYKTIWAEKENVCTWSPTGRNVEGGKPTREIKSHRSDEKVEI